LNDRDKSAELSSAFAVVLDPGGPQTGKSVLVDGSLPVEELVDTERIARAGFFEREQATADGGDNLGFAADNPTTGVPGR
jgi:hypothetical protein